VSTTLWNAVKILSIAKTSGGKKHVNSSYSTAKNMPKIAEMKLSSCGLQKKLRSCGCRATFL
jgi:hypothetical protein